jgi:uncharacterized membrane protein
MADAPVSSAERDLSSLLTITHVVYGLLAASLLVGGITAVIAVIVNYVKLDDVRGTWLESHFRWQIRTFWWGLVWLVVGFIAWIILLGWVVWIVAAIWFIYRIVKGWLNLNDKKPVGQRTED